MKHATATLEGPLLDIAVAVALGIENSVSEWGSPWVPNSPWAGNMCKEMLFSPSTDWAQGGPLIERHRITIARRQGGGWIGDANGAGFWSGATPLIAAMRALVASKLGDEVEL